MTKDPKAYNVKNNFHLDNSDTYFLLRFGSFGFAARFIFRLFDFISMSKIGFSRNQKMV
jgi:hypothetical protein